MDFVVSPIFIADSEITPHALNFICNTIYRPTLLLLPSMMGVAMAG